MTYQREREREREEKSYNDLAGKTRRNRLIVKLRCRLDNNIKLDCYGIG